MKGSSFHRLSFLQLMGTDVGRLSIYVALETVANDNERRLCAL